MILHFYKLFLTFLFTCGDLDSFILDKVNCSGVKPDHGLDQDQQ